MALVALSTNTSAQEHNTFSDIAAIPLATVARLSMTAPSTMDGK